MIKLVFLSSHSGGSTREDGLERAKAGVGAAGREDTVGI